MCVYSAISDYGRSIPFEQWTPPAWQQFKRVLAEAESFDVEAEQPECESEEKTAWMKDVERRLEILELARKVSDLEKDVASRDAKLAGYGH